MLKKKKQAGQKIECALEIQLCKYMFTEKQLEGKISKEYKSYYNSMIVGDFVIHLPNFL